MLGALPAPRRDPVLGNHDLHLVCQHEAVERTRKDDTFADILGAPDARELIEWLRARPMLYAEGRHAMVHAALLPQWTLAQSIALAREVELALTGANYGTSHFLRRSSLTSLGRTLGGWIACA